LARVLCISSYVARGHIGLGATVPALQALGHEVIALPTVVLSNHPGHAAFAKQEMPSAFLTASASIFRQPGWLSNIDAVLSGYLPTVEHVAAVADIVRIVRRENPKSIYICDPVLGDDPDGLYIVHTAASAIRDVLLPLADYITPNRFEAEWLSGVAVTTAKSAIQAASVFERSTAIITSVPSYDNQTLGNLLVEPGHTARLYSTQRWAHVAHGTGDLLAGLFVGHLLNNHRAAGALARATAGLTLATTGSQGRDELDLTNSRGRWLDIKPAISHIVQ
jgi:pyridoxine kinase